MNKETRSKELIRSVKFLFISISAGIIQALSFTLFSEVFKWEEWVAHLTALLLSILWNFTINRKYTFKSTSNVKVAMLLVLAFYAVFTPLSTYLMDFATDRGVNGLLAEAVAMICNFILEFLYYRFVVYRNSCDTAEKKENK